jgi:hypothetical protein
MILSWPESDFFRSLSGEPAMTLVPNLLVTGILAALLSLALLLWAVLFVQRENGARVMILLSIALLLVGGGIFPTHLRCAHRHCGNPHPFSIELVASPSIGEIPIHPGKAVALVVRPRHHRLVLRASGNPFARALSRRGGCRPDPADFSGGPGRAAPDDVRRLRPRYPGSDPRSLIFTGDRKPGSTSSQPEKRCTPAGTFLYSV